MDSVAVALFESVGGTSLGSTDGDTTSVTVGSTLGSGVCVGSSGLGIGVPVATENAGERNVAAGAAGVAGVLTGEHAENSSVAIPAARNEGERARLNSSLFVD